jgi:hypothetical protein
MRCELDRYQRRRSAEEEKQVEDCTFKPKINKQSRISAARKRGHSAGPVHKRLYEAGSPRVKERKSKSRASVIEDEEMKECTFKPRINRYRCDALRAPW